MAKLTVDELLALEPRDYMTEVKSRLRDDEAWFDLIRPELIVRTRTALRRMIDSINNQIEKHRDEPNDKWLGTVTKLRTYCEVRMSDMTGDAPQESVTRQSGMWRAFSARLATALRDGDSAALDAIQAPYGALSARQWLDAREAKQKVGA